MSPVRVVVAGLLATLLLGGCTGSSGRSADRGPTGSAAAGDSASGGSSGSASATASVAVPAPPRPSACYGLTTAELTRPTNASPAVPCDRPHTAQTIYVGTLDTVVDGHAVAVDSDVVQHQLAATCPRKLAEYVGGSATARRLSRFNVVWFSPTLEQSDAGARWFRCDLVAFAGLDRLLPLPRAGRLRNVLDDATALDAYGLCGTSSPGARGFQRVICGRPHSWRAVATVDIRGGARYPGSAAARAAGNNACKALARARSGNRLKFRYGWEWPTEDQWRRGQHYGFCWLPD